MAGVLMVTYPEMYHYEVAAHLEDDRRSAEQNEAEFRAYFDVWGDAR
jgi:hypothetical protein